MAKTLADSKIRTSGVEPVKKEAKEEIKLPSEEVKDLRGEVLSITETPRGYYEVLLAVNGKVSLGQIFDLKVHK